MVAGFCVVSVGAERLAKAECHEECIHWDTVGGKYVCTEGKTVCSDPPPPPPKPYIKPNNKTGGGSRE
jgi:hypothetical protein